MLFVDARALWIRFSVVMIFEERNSFCVYILECIFPVAQTEPEGGI